MTLTILGIISFQLYWLKQNYDREEKTLNLKTDIAFRETIVQLQAKNLKLENNLDFVNDTNRKNGFRVFIGNGHPPETEIAGHRKEIATTLSIVSKKLKDSLQKTPGEKDRVVVSLKQEGINIENDSFKIHTGEWNGSGGKRDFVMRFLYSVDSLQDSLKIKEVTAACSNVLDDQKINIPFTITRHENLGQHKKEEPGKVTVGFTHPVTYQFNKGNSFPYLLKRMTSPVLFSFFLITLTILSFVLLYRNMQKQQRLAELKNDFISNITHELKTPIATVGVAIEALKNFNAMQNPERTKEYLDISSHELQRLNLLVDKVLKLALFEKKEIELNRELIDLKTLVDEVTSSMRLQLEKKNASLTVNASGDTTLHGDRLHLLSVAFNLLDNAVKYGPENPVIKISVAGKENFVELRVADNGAGIPDEYREKVFEKFFRVPVGNVHNIKGYGLGLSYVAGVIKKHNGTITVENRENGGAEFIITIPKTSA